MRFGTLNVGSLYRAGSPQTVASKLENYNLDPVAVKEVRWVNNGSEPADDYTVFYGNGNANHNLGLGIFIHKGIISAVKREEIIIYK
jgi:hypothetical protein